MIEFSENNKTVEGCQVGKETEFSILVTANEETFINGIRVSCGGCTSATLTGGNPIKTEKPSTLNIKFNPTSSGYNSKSVSLLWKERNGEDRTSIFSFNAQVREKEA